MKREPVQGVQPAVFRWARQSIGLSIAEVARTLKRPEEEIAAWESGQDTPSYPQLEKLAYQIYKRPLAVFFLPSPPEEIHPEREFRTLPAFDMQTLSPDTYLHIRRARAYQISLNELFNGKNPVNRPIWQFITLSVDQPIIKQAANIRKFLGIDSQIQCSWSNDEEALKQWRQAIEDKGIFVFKNSFKQKEISGFCLRDTNFPIIYINNSTSKTRQIFSLLHELAHLLMNINGLSKFNTDYIDHLPNSEKVTEKFCNAIAAESLIPSDDFAAQTYHLPFNIESVSEDELAKIANRYHVSREAVLRKFLDQGRISEFFYQNKAKIWRGQQKKGSGGNYYLTQNSYLSQRFTKEVVGQYYRHQITMEQASELLGIKASNFSGLEQKILMD